MTPSVSITVWDSESALPDDCGLVYSWNGYAEHGTVRSLLRYVEAHGERLRRKYLAWIHELGESGIAGRRLIDQLVCDNGLSYWWMTPFVEQNPWMSPAIVDVIRLFALEEILVAHPAATVRLVTANNALAEVFADLCHALGVAHVRDRALDRRFRRWSLRRVYRALPLSLQALASLARSVCVSWPLRRANRSGWFDGPRAVFFCSYFANLDATAAERGHFRSQYWGGLPSVLNRLGLRHNWLELFIPCAEVPTARAGRTLLERFNRRSQEEGFHAFVETFISGSILWRVLKNWIGLTVWYWRLRAVSRGFRPQGSRLSLWPLFRREWRSAMRGPMAITNLLQMQLFDAALSHVPRQQRGVFLSENQPWERAFVHAWRKHGHGELIAVAHATVRFWDLRFFSDPRTIRSAEPHAMPRADLVALNGQAAIDAYRSVDYPDAAMVPCEALRYGYLTEVRATRASRRGAGSVIRVIVLGDYFSFNTRKMLQLLEAAAPRVSIPATYTVKPHPNCPVDPADYPSMALTVRRDPLVDCLPDFDVAFASSGTSACVDAYVAGLPVVIMLEATQLNFSPMRAHPGARFVSTAEELSAALQLSGDDQASAPDRSEFFFLDPDLSRWRQALTERAVEH